MPPIPPDMTEIVVGAQNVIPRGTRITADAVKLAPWPNDSVPEDAYLVIEDVLNLVAREDIAMDVPVTEGKLVDLPDLQASGSDASLQIPAGKVGYAMAVAGNASVAWAIQPGDHVDVLISVLFVDFDEEFQSPFPHQVGCISPSEEEGCSPGSFGRIEVLANGWVVNMVPSRRQTPRMATQMIVQDVTVLHVGAWEEEVVIEPPPPAEEAPAEAVDAAAPVNAGLSRWVTLIVTPQDALVLKYAEEAGGSIDLVLRSANDRNKGVVTTEAVTLQYILDRFSIEVPGKLPYGLTPAVNNLRPGAAGEVGGQLQQSMDAEGGGSAEYPRKAPADEQLEQVLEAY